MKQKIVWITSFILFAFVFTSCIFSGPSIKGNGKVVQDKRDVGEFEEIKASRGMNVYITLGDNFGVVVKADENLLKAIETHVEGDALRITANRNIKKASSNKVFVTVPDVRFIKASAGSNVFSENTIKVKNLELICSAGSNLKMELDVDDLNVSASAGSNMKLEGTTESFDGMARAGSNIKASELHAKNTYAKTSSGSNIWINTTNNFEGHASSGGNIFYYGNPGSTEIHKSSGGSVIKK